MLSLDMYHTNKAALDGKRPDCRQCHNAACNSRYSPIKRSEWYDANKTEVKGRVSEWRLKNSEKVAAWNAAYRARQREQTCECCEPADFFPIYKDRPEGHHVDHIIPLVLGGLHCVKNLQYLTAEENLKKGGRNQE